MTPDPDRRDTVPAGSRFGDRLRELRLRAGLSQVALAGEDLHPSYVSLLESGRRRPTPAAVKVLAARLGVSAEALLDDTETLGQDRLLLVQTAVGTGRSDDAVRIVEETLAAGVEIDRAAPLGFGFALTYATALERTGRLAQATAEYERLRAVAEQLPQLPWLPVVMALVRCYRDSGDLARAADLGEAAITRCRELRLVGADGHAALVSTLAGVYSERGDHLRSKVLLDELIEQVDEAGPGGSLTDRAYAYWNAAINAADRGHVGEGVRLAERAATLLAETEDERSRARIQITRAWVLLGLDEPDATSARRLLRSALPGLRQHAGALSVASAETELARCELLLGRPEVAARVARSALKRLDPEHRIERARALVTLGSALIDGGDTSLGVLELAGAAQALEQVGSSRQAAPVWRQLGDVYRGLGDPDRALDAADRAMDAGGVAAPPQRPKPTVQARTRSAGQERRLRAAQSDLP